MASKAVVTLLATAGALATKVEDAELTDCIEALEFLGEDANGNAQEYKDLKEVVTKLEAEQNADDEDDEPKDETLKKAKKLSYMGIKQIGNLWYSSKDKYKKSFATADECAKHFNS